MDDMDQASQDLHERGLLNLVAHLGSDGALLSSQKGHEEDSQRQPHVGQGCQRGQGTPPSPAWCMA